MLILGLDTAGAEGGLALVEATDASFTVLGEVALSGRGYAEQLMPSLAGLLENSGKSVGDIEAYAVISGPGSFTGLRVGLATVKGLAEVFDRPLAAVSVLDLMAAGRVDKLSEITVVMDAGRGEVFAATYSPDARASDAVLWKMEEFASAHAAATIITPDALVAERLLAFGISARVEPRPSAGDVAGYGWRMISAGEATTAELLDANYVRRSDAELYAKRTEDDASRRAFREASIKVWMRE